MLHNYEVECFSSASYMKPKIHLDAVNTSATFNNDKQFKLKILQNEKKIPNKKYIHVSPNKEIYQLLHSYDEAKYQCNKTGFTALLELVKEIMNEKDPKKSIVLIDSLFNVKIEKILENNRDKFLVNELINMLEIFIKYSLRICGITLRIIWVYCIT